MKDALLADSKPIIEFWTIAMTTIAYLKNFLLISYKEKVLEKLWTWKKENINHFVIFGCLAYIEIFKKKRKKS